MSYEALDAIRKGDLERLRRELQSEPTIAGACDEQGVSLLLQALYSRQPEMVELFLAQREALDVFEAAALGHVEALSEQINRDPALIGAFSGDGFTPLHLAAFFGNEKTTRLLLERGALVGELAKNPMVVPPLNSAVAGGNAEVVKLILHTGANVESRQAGGFTSLMSAAAAGRRELVELLLSFGADRESRSDAGKSAADLARERGFSDLANELL